MSHHLPDLLLAGLRVLSVFLAQIGSFHLFPCLSDDVFDEFHNADDGQYENDYSEANRDIGDIFDFIVEYVVQEFLSAINKCRNDYQGDWSHDTTCSDVIGRIIQALYAHSS